jgi:hypothetical protein
MLRGTEKEQVIVLQLRRMNNHNGPWSICAWADQYLFLL